MAAITKIDNNNVTDLLKLNKIISKYYKTKKLRVNKFLGSRGAWIYNKQW